MAVVVDGLTNLFVFQIILVSMIGGILGDCVRIVKIWDLNLSVRKNDENNCKELL